MWASKANQAKETDNGGISTDIFGVLTTKNHHNASKAEQRTQIESTETWQNTYYYEKLTEAFAIWPHIQSSLKVTIFYFSCMYRIYACMGKLDSK